VEARPRGGDLQVIEKLDSRRYVVTCDRCGCRVVYYTDSPSDLSTAMRFRHWKTVRRDGALRHYCAKCAEGDR
jgi:hypothetical protein